MEMEGRISKAAAWKWEIICIPLTNYFTSFTFTATFPCGWLEGGGGIYFPRRRLTSVGPFTRNRGEDPLRKEEGQENANK